MYYWWGSCWYGIEDKLRIMTDHISNVTQRCLQGKYDNIYEYNKVAEQNAEAYQIIMLMDFPAGLSEQSLRLLEQISTSGPKCGVFTIIYRNETQFSKIPERSQPLVTNIENGFQVFDYSDDAKNITCSKETVKGQPLLWSGIEMPSAEYMDKIIDILKKGIKSADKVVIGIDKVNRTENEREPEEASTKNGIRIPIGLHGANEVQYLTLGVGGSHHALIAGVAGSGKSSLLHTIILQALSQYGPDELRIYLVDFKRGVEFKIYADYKLPSFEVVAIESEREFGYNILKALEREQKIRADRFKRVKERKIDRIEDYRALPNAAPMPRILVIMDEFHELFSNASDKIGKESAEMMERIVRQGRAFGVHIILASQSYSNVGGLDKSVYDQMAVRIVLKCSKTDASLLLGDGSSDVDQISIDDPGRAIYNSEAGNKEYNSHFRVAFIDPSKHREILEGVSERTCKLSNNKTRILLSNIEDNKYSIFNQFTDYDMEACKVPGRLYLGEPLSVVNNLNMDLVRNEYSNMLMVGSDSDKARSMFAFAMLSLAINYWVSHNKKAPEEPFIYFLNYKPLRDDYFIDAPNILATELLTKYVKNIPISNPGEIRSIIQKLYSVSMDTQGSVSSENKYLMVFGYLNAKVFIEPIKKACTLSVRSQIYDGNEPFSKVFSNEYQLKPGDTWFQTTGWGNKNFYAYENKTYQWRVEFDGKDVYSQDFYFYNGKIKKSGVPVKDVKLFASKASGALEADRDKYSMAFKRESLEYVYFKLFIEEPGQDTVVQIFLKVICLEDDSVFYDKYILHHLEADTYACWNGIGFNQKGKWKAGLYKYSLRVGTGSVYEGTFTVY